MKWPVALCRLTLMTPLLVGCGQAPRPPAQPVPPGGGPAHQVDDSEALLKAVTAASSHGGSAAGGAGNGTMQVGSHTLKTNMDVPATEVMEYERATVLFHGRTLVVEFDKGRVLLDDKEQAKLPAGTKEVAVQFLGGKLSVSADGTGLINSIEIK